jgi:hypothetical protein
MRPFIENWEEVATGLVQRVRREALGHVIDATTVNLLNELRKYPGVKELNSVPKAQSPVLPITFVRGRERRSYFSLIITVGTPQCITAQELRIECSFRWTQKVGEDTSMESPLITSDRPQLARQTGHLTIGCLAFHCMDQIDFTGPYGAGASAMESSGVRMSPCTSRYRRPGNGIGTPNDASQHG